MAYKYIFFQLLSTGLLIYSIWCGLGLTYDSRAYIEISNDIIKHGWEGLENSPFLKAKPPLFPLVISLFSPEGMIWVNVFCFTLYLGLLARVVLMESGGKNDGILLFLFICMATPLYEFHGFLWTEPIANPIVLALFLGVKNYLDHQKSTGLLPILLLSNALILIRHAGLFIVLGIFVALFFISSDGERRKRVILSAPFAFLTSLIWHIFKPESFVLRFGEISQSDWSVKIDKYYNNMIVLTDALTSYFLPIMIPYHLRISLLIICVIAVVVLYYRKIPHEKYHLAWTLVIVIYILCMHIVVPIIPGDGERYLSPIYPMLFILLYAAVKTFVSSLRRNWQKRIALLLVAIALGYPVIRTIKNVRFWHTVRCQEKTRIISKEQQSYTHFPSVF